MKVIDFHSYSPEVLKEVLAYLKQYKLRVSQIGKRGALDRDPEEIRVFYSSGLVLEDVQKVFPEFLQKTFPSKTFTSSPILQEDSTLTSGIRIFYGDELIDVSLDRFENLLKK